MSKYCLHTLCQTFSATSPHTRLEDGWPEVSNAFAVNSTKRSRFLVLSWKFWLSAAPVTLKLKQQLYFCFGQLTDINCKNSDIGYAKLQEVFGL